MYEWYFPLWFQRKEKVDHLQSCLQVHLNLACVKLIDTKEKLRTTKEKCMKLELMNVLHAEQITKLEQQLLRMDICWSQDSLWHCDTKVLVMINSKTRAWIRRRSSKGCYNNIVKKLMIEDTAGYKEMMRMNHGNFWICWALRVRGLNKLSVFVQMHSTFLSHTWMTAKQRKCWAVLSEKFDQFQI